MTIRWTELVLKNELFNSENAENEELQKAEEYELYEMIGTVEGQTFKERRLDRGEYPVAVQLIWSRQPIGDETAPRNRFVLRFEKIAKLFAILVF